MVVPAARVRSVRPKAIASASALLLAAGIGLLLLWPLDGSSTKPSSSRDAGSTPSADSTPGAGNSERESAFDSKSRQQSEAFSPSARPAPSSSQIQGTGLSDEELTRLRADADSRHAVGLEQRQTVGSLGGKPMLHFAWGDVENYANGQVHYDRDAIVVRVIRRVGSESDHFFYVTSYDARSLEPGSTYSTEGWSFDEPFRDSPETAWAE